MSGQGEDDFIALLDAAAEEVKRAKAGERSEKARKEVAFATEPKRSNEWTEGPKWQLEGYVLRVTRVWCLECGTAGDTIEGIYREESLPRNGGRRLFKCESDEARVLQEEVAAAVPRRLEFTEVEATACVDCAESFGFDALNPGEDGADVEAFPVKVVQLQLNLEVEDELA